MFNDLMKTLEEYTGNHIYSEDDFNKWIETVSLLDPEDKGTHLGNVLEIRDQVRHLGGGNWKHMMIPGIDYSQLDELCGQLNNKILVHVMYLRQSQQLGFYLHLKEEYDIRVAINGCADDAADWFHDQKEDLDSKDLAIKFIELLADRVLD